MKRTRSEPAQRKEPGHGAEVEAILRGEPAAVARAISCLQWHEPGEGELLAAIAPRAGRAFRVGFTGPGGVGKSSLLREIVRSLRREGERVAVIAADPASVVSEGAFLADRCRFGQTLEDPEVFFRSVAHRGVPGEPAPAAALAAEVLDAAGFPWLLLETVGAGQMDVGVLGDVHLKVLVLSPQCGDDLQMMKAGLVEVADLVVVNKVDQAGGRAWAKRLAETLNAAAGQKKVIAASASSGEGLDLLVAELKERKRSRGSTG